jgi:hypothetical protein
MGVVNWNGNTKHVLVDAHQKLVSFSSSVVPDAVYMK